MAAPRVSIQADDFDLGAEVAALRAGDGGVGAVAAFIGTVRERNDGAGGAVARARALSRHDRGGDRGDDRRGDARASTIRAARVVHRVGALAPTAQIVLVAVTAAHRGEAFQACEFLMDYLKTQAPFWKKETGAGRRALGRRARRRRRRAGALGHRRRQRRSAGSAPAPR